MKTKIWKFTGYSGYSDYDGKCDDNAEDIIILDARLKEQEVREIILKYFLRPNRCLAISSLTEIKEQDNE